MRPGELNEVVEEVDEDISDDVLSSPRRDREIKEALPQSIHERTDSNTVLDVQTSDRTRKASQEYTVLKNRGHLHTPSMTEENKFEPAPRSDASNEEENEHNFEAANHEADPSDLNNEPVEEQKKSDTRPIEKKVPVLRLDLLASHVPPVQKQVASAKATHHHRNRSIGENPFIARDSATVQSTTESNETP